MDEKITLTAEDFDAADDAVGDLDVEFDLSALERILRGMRMAREQGTSNSLSTGFMAGVKYGLAIAEQRHWPVVLEPIAEEPK